MKKILEELKNLHYICNRFDNELIQSGLSDSDPRVGCFIMVQKQVILTLELLEYYYRIWGNPPPINWSKEDIEYARKENAERVMIATKCMFMLSFSNIEHNMKRCITEIQEFGALKKAKYLDKIIQESVNKGYITLKDKKMWDCVRRIRNYLAHNNGISEINMDCNIDELHIELRKEQMIKGPLDIFIVLTRESVNLYRLWIKAIAGL